MTQRNTRMFAGVAGAALLLTGSGLALNALNPNSADASDAASGTTHSFNENVVEASWVNVDDGSYVRVPNVQGSFVFNQLGTTPNDELFNVFGAALTSMCSKPAGRVRSADGRRGQFLRERRGPYQEELHGGCKRVVRRCQRGGAHGVLVRYRLSVRTGCGARRAAGVHRGNGRFGGRREHRDGVWRRTGSASLCRCATLWSMMRCSSTR